ncbi:MAG: SpoIIE family protein phosphatase [Bacteroidales bacterium]|nr:SpoIIE family protein phosphatase [Bacteroidales bacterium]
MKKLFLLILFISILSVSFVNAQKQHLQFEQITNKSGRSLGFITGIVQDNQGFMWFSTRSGLVRYDGYDYKLFKKNPKDSTSLPYNDIANLYYDKSGILWMLHYDQYFPFKDEKLNFEYDSITNQHFDLQAKIIEDNDNNLWIGPSPKGLMKYNKTTKQSQYFKQTLPLYSPKALAYLDSFMVSQTATCKLIEISNDADTSISFELKEDKDILVVSAGEADNNTLYDYGFISQNKKTVWQMNYSKLKHAGGSAKNKIQIDLIKLKKGKYKLNYKSDNSNSYGKWDGAAPDKINFYGIQLFCLPSNQIEYFKQHIIKDYHPENYIFSNSIKDFLIDNTGNFCFLSDKGIHKYVKEKNTFINYNIDYCKLLGSDFESPYLMFYQDNDNDFWIGTNTGLIKYNQEKDKFLVFKNTKTKSVLTSNTIYTIYQDNDGAIWVGTDKGLNIYDKKKDVFYKYTADNDNRLYDNKIIKFYDDRSSNLWVATFEGLNRLKKSRFKHYNLDIDRYAQFPVCIDKKKRIWYRGNDNYLFSYNLKNRTIRKFPVSKDFFNYDKIFNVSDYFFNNIFEDSQNNLWISVDNGLINFNRISKRVTDSLKINAVVVNEDSIKNKVCALAEDSYNNLWLFSLEGIYHYNRIKHKLTDFVSFNLNYEDIFEVDRKFIKFVLLTNKGDFMIRTTNGVYKFNPKQKKIKLLLKFDEEIKSTSLTEGNIYQAYDGNIWIAALPNLYEYDKNFKLHTYKVNDSPDLGFCNIFQDKDSLIWIYTNNGLFNFTKTNQEFRHYSIDDGLVDNSINGMIDDGRGNLWITSLKGLTKFEKSDQTCVNFFRSSDYTSYYFLGNPSRFKSPKGEVILFTNKGFLSFFPDSINYNKPNMVVDNFTLFGKEYKFDSLIYKKKYIKLKFNQNFLAFEFSALDYTDPSKNKYSYFLDGLDVSWTNCDADNRKATYTGVSPGEYVFRLKGSNSDNVWNEKGIKLHIIITPPWYKTTLAYILYVLGFLFALYMFIHIREKKLIKEKMILEQKVVERTAEVVKQRDQISEQKKNITDSIQYASRIQRALLPSEEYREEILPDHFILFRPRDIVSGDYYWMKQKNGKTIVVAADCTGHGVPGAFMSMLGVAFLNEIANRDDINEANEILNSLRTHVIKALHQTGKEGESKDGMDIALCVIDADRKKMQFAGAYNPLYLIRNNELIQVKADRMPIGFYFKEGVDFKNNEVNLEKDDKLYIFSDGFADQFGGKDGRKFMSKKFKQLLTDINQKPMSVQHDILDTTIDKWRGDIEQIDDVLIVGLKI